MHKAINIEEQNSVPPLLQNKYKNEFSEQPWKFSRGSFGTVTKVLNKNSKKFSAIKRIALNEEDSKKAFKELNLMKGLKSRFVVECIDSWIEKNESLSHPILLHIQMEFCCQELNEIIIVLSKEMKENDSQDMKTLCYYICCELLSEIIECVRYLHVRNVIHRDLKPANILITDGINGRFVKLADFGLSVNHEYKT
jgi:serine/threonine protein kinase